jgi:hypothetical protein
VQVLRAVDGEADKEVLLVEELAPGVIDIRAVGLEIVLASHMRRAVSLLQLHDPAEKVETEQSWLSALPGENGFLVVLAFEVLTGECLVHLVGDTPLFRFAQQLLLREVVAIGAVKIAERARGLHHDMHAPHGLAAIEAAR